VLEPRANGSFAAVSEELVARLRKSVEMQMISDVPLGAFLSGGIDSSLIVSMMKAAGSNRVRTFSIGFREPEYDEARYAHAVARHLGTEHHELYVTAEEALGVIPLLPSIYDEPFADSSQIPTFLVSRLARQHVIVSLSGDGGDELFGGYRHYHEAMRRWGRIRMLPRVVRHTASRGIALLSPDAWDRVWAVTRRFAPPSMRRKTNAGVALHRIGEALGSDDVDAFYRRFISQWQGDSITAATPSAPRAPRPKLRSAVHAMMYADMTSYLPDDILVKLDRATMAVSLEGRVPFLDPGVIELAWRLPASMKIRNGSGKWILRRLLERRVPRELIERPKMGFGVPIDEWLRGPLREWADDLLDERRLREDGLLNAGRVRKRWDEHVSGRGVWHIDLWNVLMFQAWRRSQARAGSASAVA
jgi:asparagine synthase (glutamine-hydrolysing)